MARKSAPPKVEPGPPKKKAKSQRRRFISVRNPRSWAKDRIKGDKVELQMWDGVAGFVAHNQRKLRKKIKQEETDLAEARVKPLPGGCCT